MGDPTHRHRRLAGGCDRRTRIPLRQHHVEAIGDGLRRRRPDDRRPFHTYDRFRFEHQAQLLDDVPDLLTYSEGGSFREVFDRRIVSVAEHVTVHEGEIEEQTWHPDAPIAFLFNDISKSWTTWLAVRRAFYRALVPGSVVVEQDFAHAYVPWLHLTHCRWREHFEVLGWIPGSTSLVMRVVSPIPACELDRDDLVAGYTPRELQLAFDWAESVGMPEHRASIRGARIMLYILHGDLDVATRELATATAAGLLDDSTIASVYAPARRPHRPSIQPTGRYTPERRGGGAPLPGEPGVGARTRVALACLLTASP